jgi:hypothetical protein
MKRFTIIKIAFLLSFVLLVKANRVIGQDFEVAPVLLEFNSEPGENQFKIINIKNHSNVKASFIISIADFLPSSSGEKRIMAPNSTKRSCANWLNINPSFFELNPGDEIPIQIGMMVPTDQYSAAWCMLYIQPSREQTTWSADKNLGAGVTVTGRIGVLIYQTPKSNTNNSLKISSMAEITKVGDVVRTFTATVENLGERITKGRAYLIASNIKTSEEKQFKAIDFEVFPKMSRTIKMSLPNELQPGSYSLATIVDYGTKFALEGTQIMIEVKDSGVIRNSPDVNSDTAKVK